MLEKLKSIVAKDETYYAIVLLLIGIFSFALGKLSERDIQFTLAPINQTGAIEFKEASASSTVYFVASKNGSKYHLPWCPGTSQIKEENELRFTSKEAAEAAGYTPAANCPGIGEMDDE